MRTARHRTLCDGLSAKEGETAGGRDADGQSRLVAEREREQDRVAVHVCSCRSHICPSDRLPAGWICAANPSADGLRT